MHEKNRTYEKRIGDLERDNTRLEAERRRLIDDPVYFEKVAREKMGIIKDGEVIYKIVGQGQKKDGAVSEEASLIIKQESDSDDKPKKATVKPKAEVKPAAVKKSTSTKAAPSKSKAKKTSKSATSKVTTNSTKQ